MPSRLRVRESGFGTGMWRKRQIFLSARWKEMLGFGDHDLESSIDVWFDRIHADDRQHFSDLLTCRATSDQGQFETELRMRHRTARSDGCCAVESFRAMLRVFRVDWPGHLRM